MTSESDGVPVPGLLVLAPLVSITAIPPASHIATNTLVLSTEATVNIRKRVAPGAYRVGYRGAVAQEATGGTAYCVATKAVDVGLSNVIAGALGYSAVNVFALKMLRYGITQAPDTFESGQDVAVA